MEVADPIPGPSHGVSRPKKTNLVSLYESFLLEQDELAATQDDVEAQLHKYLAQPTIIRDKEGAWGKTPFQYWDEEHGRFPAVASVAKKFLSAPSTSVESERLFSTTANIVNVKRNSLKAKRAEMLIFLKKNLPKSSSSAPLSEEPEEED